MMPEMKLIFAGKTVASKHFNDGDSQVDFPLSKIAADSVSIVRSGHETLFDFGQIIESQGGTFTVVLMQ